MQCDSRGGRADSCFVFIRMEMKDAAVNAIMAMHSAQIEGYTVK